MENEQQTVGGLQKLFSVTNTRAHKIVSILGLRLKFRTSNMAEPAISLGKHSYLPYNVIINHADTKIGNFCSVANGATIGAGTHPTNFLSTHPFQYVKQPDVFGDVGVPDENLKNFDYFMPVMVGNDVWIGKNATLMDGITIADGAIIGAHSVVTKDVPPYALLVGNPAHQLGWMSEFGHRLKFDANGIAVCPESKQEYSLAGNKVKRIK